MAYRLLGTRVVHLVLIALMVSSVTACSGEDPPAPEDTAATLVAALNRGDLRRVAFVSRSGPEPQRYWKTTSAGMEGAAARVALGEVTTSESGETATATLRYTWSLPRTERTWQHQGTARMVLGAEDGRWRVRLAPGLLGLREGERLALSMVAAERAPILGRGGVAIVEDRPVLRFGIDKARVATGRQLASARALARVVDVDAGGLVDRVRSAGPKAFVEAIVLRKVDAVAALQAIEQIRGARAVEDTLPLAPTRDFARPLLGSVGPVTAEIVEESDGAYEAGDEVGLSGLQERYDLRLRGTPGIVVTAVAGESSRELFRSEPEPGEPLRTTLEPGLQAAAEQVLADVGPASALVALRPSTGDILAAASGPGSQGYSTATIGRYAPGSTFKIVSSLALLRGGLRAGDALSCPDSTVVEGKAFENYDDYPPGSLGRITLATAVAQSCNTAFITARDRVGALDEAAAALGLGVDHDLGFPAYFGSVPADAGAETGRAAAMIGQGKVLASPMAMAAVVASVAEGSTVVPRLLPGHEPERATPAPARPLTAAEARTLRTLLRGVVERGSGRGLADVPGGPVIAKTGTAEFGEPGPSGALDTHAWMVAARGDLAVAAFVEVGDSGSGTAGPLLEALLRAR